MLAVAAALALCAASGAARADELADASGEGGPLLLPGPAFQPAPMSLQPDAPFARRSYAGPGPTRRRDAREGFIFSLGIGGAQTYLSGVGHAAATALDLRFGYGFSDRFQLLFDFTGLPTDYNQGFSATSWTTTVRGQTVLIGDRRGNGLNFNIGFGLGGVDIHDGYGNYYSNYGGGYGGSRVGLAFASGLSLDLRVTPWFALEPEFIAQWHQVPNDYGRASDVNWAVGGQLNFVWYTN